MKSKSFIENQILFFKKEDKKRKKITVEENFYILLYKKTEGEIKGSLIYRIDRNREKKICKISIFKEKGKYRVDYDFLVKKINETRVISKKDKIDKNTRKFKNYFKEFEEELKNKIKDKYTDVNKKALLNFNKYFSYWQDKGEQDVNERNILDFCNFIFKKQEAKGAAVGRKKEGCYAAKMGITTLRKFLNFLFLKGVIKKETLEVANNFVLSNYFTNCKKLMQNQTAFRHFNSLQDVREFYDFILTLKQFLEDFVEGDFREREYIARELLGYRNTSLFNINKAESMLYKIYVTEFLLLTGIRGADFFRIQVNNIKWQDSFIYFHKTKNGQEYYLYLTDYLYNLLFDIHNLAQEITKKNAIIATTHSNLRNFFNTFYNKTYGYNINIHGFRHTFKTLATQYLSYPDIVVEEQIQHTKKGIIKNYLKGDLKEQRLKLLEDYRLLITPLHLKYFCNLETKQEQEEKIRKELESFFNNILYKYNIKKEELIKILFKYF